MDSPLDRIRRQGLSGALASDLLAVGVARRPEDAVAEPVLALVQKLGGQTQLFRYLSPGLLKDEFGLDDFEAVRVMALVELGRRSAQAGPGKDPDFTDPAQVNEYLSRFRNDRQEHFVVLCLDNKNFLLRDEVAHKGTTDMSLAEPKDVFRAAIQAGATSVILAHNHPSGDPTPSPEDVQVTRRMVQAGQLVGITVLDHIILGKPGKGGSEQGFYSFRRGGLIS